MKKILILLSFFSFLFLNVGMAQTQSDRSQVWKSGKEIFEARLQKMKANLELSEEQVVSLREVNDGFAKRLEDIRANTTDRMESMEKMKAFQNDMNAEYKKHLTEPQFAKLEEARKRVEDRAKRVEQANQ